VCVRVVSYIHVSAMLIRAAGWCLDGNPLTLTVQHTETMDPINTKLDQFDRFKNGHPTWECNITSKRHGSVFFVGVLYC
jgi:hypothetical protein